MQLLTGFLESEIIPNFSEDAEEFVILICNYLCLYYFIVNLG